LEIEGNWKSFKVSSRPDQEMYKRQNENSTVFRDNIGQNFIGNPKNPLGYEENISNLNQQPRERIDCHGCFLKASSSSSS
jgi:hypothetical protein